MVTEMKKGIMKKMVAVGMMIAVTATVMTACGNKEYTVSDLTKMKVEKYVTTISKLFPNHEQTKEICLKRGFSIYDESEDTIYLYKEF